MKAPSLVVEEGGRREAARLEEGEEGERGEDDEGGLKNVGCKPKGVESGRVERSTRRHATP
jgi:hypothetical protein